MNRGPFRKICACLCLCALLLSQTAVPARAARFKDVPSGFWAASEIGRCAELGFFKGQKADEFGVGRPMTRASFVVVLSRFFGWETAAPLHSSFADVKADDWYASELQAACEHGVVTRQSGSFRPEEPVTREEIAVMLVRALGYGSLAGAAAEDPLGLRDVYTNRGYIAVAYELGLVGGYPNGTFVPDRAATREQVAVMLIRMYDKLRQNGGRMAIVSGGEQAAELDGVDTVLVSAAEFIGMRAPILFDEIGSGEETALLRRIREAGKEALLCISGDSDLWKMDLEEVPAIVAERAEAFQYDGICLNIACDASQMNRLAELAENIRALMPDKRVFLMIDGPARGADAAAYQRLGAAADRIVVKVAAREQKGTLPVTAKEPMDDVYAALTVLRRVLPAEKLVLQVTTTATAWNGSRSGGKLDAADVAELLRKGAQVYYSDQYRATYLCRENQTVWYLGADGIEARLQLAVRLGAQGICLSSLNGILE